MGAASSPRPTRFPRSSREASTARRLPEPGPSGPASFPAIEKSALANGLTVWTVRHAQIPVVAFSLLIRRGASSDPAGKHGLAAMTADMLDEGSGDRSAIEMHEAIARLGTQLETDIGSDAAVAGFTVLGRFADRALSLLADVVVRPALKDEDVARVRQLRLHRLTQLRDVPSAIADRAFLNLLYGEHPYGHSPIGTELALASMTVDDVRAFHERAMRPSVATLIAVGDCDHETIRRLAHDAFGEWRGAAIDGSAGDPALPRPPRLSIVPRPGAPQSELRIGHVSAPRSTPGLSRAGDGEHGARRAVQQPHQSEPARGQGFHLRRADRVRIPAPRRSVRAAGRRADERHGPVDRGIDGRDLGDGQHPPDYRQRSCAWRPRR